MPATLDHFDVPVAHGDRLASFLKEVFGWAEVEAGTNPNPRYRRLVASAGPDPLARTQPTLRVGLFEGSPEVLDRAIPVVRLTGEELEVCLARAVAAGGRVVLEPEPVPGSGRFARLEDPEGNQWGLWEPSPDSSGSGHAVAAGKPSGDGAF